MHWVEIFLHVRLQRQGLLFWVEESADKLTVLDCASSINATERLGLLQSRGLLSGNLQLILLLLFHFGTELVSMLIAVLTQVVRYLLCILLVEGENSKASEEALTHLEDV